jgi:DNA-binding response OmpR family regulator
MNEFTPGATLATQASDPAGDARGHVLLVEDDPEVAAATAALLRHFGWRVSQVSGAEDALDLIEAGTAAIDVVLADIAMPGAFDGMELAVHLRRMHPGLRVVLMTGRTAEVHRAAWDGFELLPKPCPPALLDRTLAASR